MRRTLIKNEKKYFHHLWVNITQNIMSYFCPRCSFYKITCLRKLISCGSWRCCKRTTSVSHPSHALQTSTHSTIYIYFSLPAVALNHLQKIRRFTPVEKATQAVGLESHARNSFIWTICALFYLKKRLWHPFSLRHPARASLRLLLQSQIAFPCWNKILNNCQHDVLSEKPSHFAYVKSYLWWT